jgi:hypothetical protein
MRGKVVATADTTATLKKDTAKRACCRVRSRISQPSRPAGAGRPLTRRPTLGMLIIGSYPPCFQDSRRLTNRNILLVFPLGQQGCYPKSLAALRGGLRRSTWNISRLEQAPAQATRQGPAQARTREASPRSRRLSHQHAEPQRPGRLRQDRWDVR